MTILKMYITLAPCILAGILNMLWCRTSLCRSLAKPIDSGKCLSDGKRIFGGNKTWAGFFGMIFCGAVCQTLWGFACRLTALADKNYIYLHNSNTVSLNAALGGLMGLAYVLFELPNSFVKRRLEIPSGKTVSGLKGKIFFIIDQVDSLFGVMLVYAAFYPMTARQYFLYIALGAGTHIAVNAALYTLKIRKNL